MKRRHRKFLQPQMWRPFFSAGTVLRCSRCRHEVWLEAHHRENGRPLNPDHYAHLPKRMKRRPLTCPIAGCGSRDWHYIRTEVLVGDLLPDPDYAKRIIEELRRRLRGTHRPRRHRTRTTA